MSVKILQRLFLLVLTLFVSNQVYERIFYEADIQKYSAIMEHIRELPADAEVLYVGESSNTTYREEDLDKRPISSLLSDYFPGVRFADITQPAAHAGIYRVLLEKIPEDHKIQTLIVTLNLRSFDAQWIYSTLETPFQKQLVLLKDHAPLYNRFLLSFKGYDIKNDKERERQFRRQWDRDHFDLAYPFPYEDLIEWDRDLYRKGIRNRAGERDESLSQLACHYVKAYAFQLDTLDHVRIRDFDAIVGLAKERGWNLVLNLMAENTDKAEELVGRELVYFMEENARLLKEYFEHQGVRVIDNLKAVRDDQFIDQDWTTEHYAERGRRTIAGNVAQGIRDLYPQQFVDLSDPGWVQTCFFHDCESKKYWGQENTVSQVHAFSGHSSSRTGGDAPYSLTFQRSLKDIPSSHKDSLHISFAFLTDSSDPDARLVIEAGGMDMERYWEGKPLRGKDTGKDGWRAFSLGMRIPATIREASSFKVYVFNPGEESVFIDDLEVKIW